MTNDNILSYHVMHRGAWLAEDERSWTKHFYDAASFNDPKLAQDVGERESRKRNGDDEVIYVFACLGWQ